MRNLNIVFVNTGLYMITKKIIKYIPKGQKFGIDELINILIDKKYDLQTFKINENQWFDTGQWNQFKKHLINFKCNEKNKIVIIAEAGVNHNGQLENAIKLIDQAAKSE